MPLQKILVLGLGLHGGAIGTIRYLASEACPPKWKNAQIIVADKKSKEELAPSLEKLKGITNVRYIFGEHGMELLDGVSAIIKNPAVPRDLPLLQEARRRNIPIELDSGLFFEYCPSKKIIGITGSKGKTTASSAIAHVFMRLFPPSIAVGVDGVSPLELLPQVTADTTVIFELSSWRLEALQENHISPHVAVVTSIYKDHLNTYSSFDEYIEVKKQVIRNQKEDDIALLNADDPRIRTWESEVHGKLYWFSLQPLQNDEEGIWVDGEGVFARLLTSPSRICSISDIPHSSPHELRNKLPALFLAILSGASPKDAVSALASMDPLPCRIEFIASIRDVAYINDSAATMPDATIAAIESLRGKPIILILGGSDKALEFEELAEAIAKSRDITSLVWLPGTATEKMKSAVEKHASLQSHDASSMIDAVKIAANLAKAGDTVLLSPGATSFGLFLHEFDRGDAFNRAVKGVY